MGSQTRLALQRAVMTASEHAATLDGPRSLESARRVRETVESASRLHGWGEHSKSANTLNIVSDNVNIGVL